MARNSFSNSAATSSPPTLRGWELPAISGLTRLRSPRTTHGPSGPASYSFLVTSLSMPTCCPGHRWRTNTFHLVAP
eukprot:2518319-Lingulodinium_polyedra.AAC.1